MCAEAGRSLTVTPESTDDAEHGSEGFAKDCPTTTGNHSSDR